MRLNVAAGDDIQPGYVNVDYRPTGQVVCDVAHLPFRDGAFEAVRALDILEHVPRKRTGDLLDEWHRVLEEDGWLELKVPNLERLAVTLIEDPARADLFIENIYGGRRWGPDGAWDAHAWGWTPATLERDLDRHRFEQTSNNHALNMTVEAVAW